jgi:catalase
VTKKRKLSTTAGAPVADIHDVMTAALHGPNLLQNQRFLEKLARFDREVIPEHPMHATGSAAAGTNEAAIFSPAK